MSDEKEQETKLNKSYEKDGKKFHAETGIEIPRECSRCGDVRVLRLLFMPASKMYVSLCFTCFHGLRKYFELDDGTEIK